MIIHHDKYSLSQEFKIRLTAENQSVHPINGVKYKNPMIIFINAEKAFDKPGSFLDKNIQ